MVWNLGLHRVAQRALDILLPPLCLGCPAFVERHGALCAPCWQGMNFLTPPWCACCGTPFAQQADSELSALCGECLRRHPAYDSARAALTYDSGSRSLVLGFKHGDKTEAAPTFATWIKRVGADWLNEADYICPVPLHRWRLWRRRYNQAALLAKALAQPEKFSPTLLKRHRATASQGVFSRQARHKNVRQAFTISPRWKNRLADKHVVLIDDVLTTGATVQECARTLKAAGVRRVDVLTLARVVR